MAEDRLPPEATELSLSFPQGDGNLSPEARAEILSALREVPWRRVWINDVAWINTGAVGGPTIDFTAVVAGTISGVTVVALTALARQVFQIARAYFPFRIVRLRADDKPEFEYLIGPEADADAAVNAIPADYVATISTERTVRRWRDGRWDLNEIETRQVSGRPGDTQPPSLT